MTDQALNEQGKRARRAALALGALSSGDKNRGLAAIAAGLAADSERILAANRGDLERAEKDGISGALRDRLMLNPARIAACAEGLRVLIDLPDPVGEVLSQWERPNGLRISKVRVPLGVIGIIYEARPNVTVDAAGLCFKTGNAVLLRGSSSALESNTALVESLRRALGGAGLPEDAIQLVPDAGRESVERMLRLKQYIDILIPRGGAGLIDYVTENASVPVLATGAGNCHVFIDAGAPVDQAIKITVNAKAQRPSVCNAAETALVHRDWAAEHLPRLIAALEAARVECRGCERSRALVPHIKPAVEKDWETEFLDYIIAVKVVDSVAEAIRHINIYGTRHSEAILSENPESVRLFFQDVDAAALYHNASTRFTDGFEFGFGAEIGISNQKLHARGPVGLPELTSYKYLVSGSGQTRR